MKYTFKIYIAGHKGVVGTAIWCSLENKGYTNLIGKTSAGLDQRNQAVVKKFIETEQSTVFSDAARVGVFWPTGKS